MSSPSVSVVVAAYNMARELPRTLASLLPGMQLDTDKLDYEVIVVDNGSDVPVEYVHDCVRVIRIDHASPSPAHAINVGLGAAHGELVGVMIDGARIASPGIIRNSILASKLTDRPIISPLAFHLGPDVQQRSVTNGYDRDVEERLLERVRWQQDPYRLFRISKLAKSSLEGWFGRIIESQALFMSSAMWAELGGYDEEFRSPGGGYVNLDVYERACALPDSQLVILLGEGTFHQVHGGVSTNAIVDPGTEFHSEYRSIRGHDHAIPEVDAMYLGAMSDEFWQSAFPGPESDTTEWPMAATSTRLGTAGAFRAKARRLLSTALVRAPGPLHANPLFDPEWYRRRYPDVAQARSNPSRHYRRHGVPEGRDPNEFFAAKWYLRRNPDVAEKGIDPLDHYYLYGANEGRDPGPRFETTWYLRRYPDVAMSGMNPLEHYLRRGRHEGRVPARNGHR